MTDVEASSPSSSTLLVLSLMPTLLFRVNRRAGSQKIRRITRAFSVLFSIFMVIGRLVTGIHWLTDLIGSALLSAGLYSLYRTAVLTMDHKRFVSHPIRSLAQAYIYRNQCQPFGIYLEDKMIGYVMVIYDYDAPEYDIWHMMIDESLQRHGYGSAALDRIIDYIRTKPFGHSDRIVLTCSKDNTSARKLYEKKGFLVTGVEDEDEIELAMTVK